MKLEVKCAFCGETGVLRPNAIGYMEQDGNRWCEIGIVCVACRKIDRPVIRFEELLFRFGYAVQNNEPEQMGAPL